MNCSEAVGIADVEGGSLQTWKVPLAQQNQRPLLMRLILDPLFLILTLSKDMVSLGSLVSPFLFLLSLAQSLLLFPCPFVFSGF